MFEKSRAQVLVVGAGPVGLFAALRLAQQGIDVEVVDKADRTNLHSYALALHPRSLELLLHADLAPAVLPRGHKVHRVGLYDDEIRHGTVDLSAMDSAFPYVLVVPQSDLERLLEEKLRQCGVTVRWSYEVQELTQTDAGVTCQIARMTDVAQGYPMMRLERVVAGTHRLQCQYVIGADGYHSAIRSAAGIECTPVGPPLHMSVFEFSTHLPASDEMCVVLDEGSVSVLWPLRDSASRWSFQRSSEAEAARLSEADLAALLAERAPWYSPPPREVRWRSSTTFQPRLADAFGKGRLWLAGDAAHMTVPIGVQSMNEGMIEAEELATTLARSLKGGASAVEGLARYNNGRLAAWRKLLALDGEPVALSGAPHWIETNRRLVMSCLPLSDGHLGRGLGQLRLSLGT